MRVFILSDWPAQSGFGRISGAIANWLHAHGHQAHVGSLMYDGLLPHNLPYPVSALAGKDLWNTLAGLIPMLGAELVICCQDFPYANTLFRATRIDWSRIPFLNITPIDGTPIRTEWLDLVDDIDGTMVISRFGVEAMRMQGRRVGLCHPGVDAGYFKPQSAESKRALREKAGIAPDAFVLGMFAMNQGRKNIPATLAAFYEFAKDKPTARLVLDMEAISPGGFDIPDMCKQLGYDKTRILYRADLAAKGIVELKDRYALLDVHSVISFREGFGLPLVESMACGVATMALDWCSGTEIVGGGRGVLIPTFGPGRVGTWGGARDFDPDMPALIGALERLYSEPGYRAAVAEAGRAWAVQ